MTPGQLQEHIYKTYVSLRVGLCLLALAFPFLLWGIGRWNDINLQNSISEYYFAFGPPNLELPGRVVFVGVLFVLGFFLILYRGFTTIENWVLNIAGACAIIIALCPMPMPDNCTNCGSNPYSSLHYPAAVVLFVCLAFVAAFCTKETLVYLPDPKRRRRYRISYYVIATIIIVTPGILYLMTWDLPVKKYKFLVETVGIVMFSAYWGLKSIELSQSKVEKNVLMGKALVLPASNADFRHRGRPRN